MANTASDVIAAVRSRGCDADDLRDAVHEACHALQARVPPPWDRERIHGYLVRTASKRRYGALSLLDKEIRARAAERQSCSRFAIEYDIKYWTMIAVMETGKTIGIWMESSVLESRIVEMSASDETAKMVDRILNLRPL